MRVRRDVVEAVGGEVGVAEAAEVGGDHLEARGGERRDVAPPDALRLGVAVHEQERHAADALAHERERARRCAPRRARIANAFGIGSSVTARSLVMDAARRPRRVRAGHRPRGARRARRPRRSCSAAARTSSAPSRTRNVCPVCLGLPGSLPVLNEQAVEYALRLAEALALRRAAERSIFARKNYFYPDMPKDYQISQYEEPILVDGWLEVDGAHDRHRARAPRGGHRQDACTSVAAGASTRPTTRSSTTTAPACR